MSGVALVVGSISAVLIYSAFKGIDPRSLLTSVFTGSPPTPLPPIGGGSTSSASVPAGSTGTADNSGATPANSAFRDAVKARYGSTVTMSPPVVVKDIAGTSTLSQHSYGNATDFFASQSVMLDLWAFSIKYATKYSIRLVIHNGKQYYGGAISPYTSTSDPHTSHVHVDFWPQYGGTPPGQPLQGPHI